MGVSDTVNFQCSRKVVYFVITYTLIPYDIIQKIKSLFTIPKGSQLSLSIIPSGPHKQFPPAAKTVLEHLIIQI